MDLLGLRTGNNRRSLSCMWKEKDKIVQSILSFFFSCSIYPIQFLFMQYILFNFFSRDGHPLSFQLHMYLLIHIHFNAYSFLIFNDHITPFRYHHILVLSPCPHCCYTSINSVACFLIHIGKWLLWHSGFFLCSMATALKKVRHISVYSSSCISVFLRVSNSSSVSLRRYVS